MRQVRRVSSPMASELAFFIVASTLPLAGIVTADGPVYLRTLGEEPITSGYLDANVDVNDVNDVNANDVRTLANSLVIASKPDGRAKKIVPESGDDGWKGS